MQKQPIEYMHAIIWIWILAATLTLGAFSQNVEPAQATENIQVDLFTQKPIFDGRGSNQSSDIFGPQEQVILYAQILSCNLPLETLVTYEIDGPTSRPDELRFYQTARTNSSGIAQTIFSLASINETDAFGLWVASASVQVNGRSYNDRLSFEVNWLVEILSVKTLDENVTEQNYFSNGGFIGCEVVWRNNAMTAKTAALKITVFDELKVSVNASEIDGLLIPPNRRTQHVFCSLHIPTEAVPGSAKITVLAAQYDGTAYSPQVSTNFWITTNNPVSPNFVDGFVYVEGMPMKVPPGQEVTVAITVRNEGTLTLNNIQIQTYIDSSRTDSRIITSLIPYQSHRFNITWDTHSHQEKIYNITSQIQTFPNEADLTDNSYSCNLEIRKVEPRIVHDIEITEVTRSKNEVYSGETIDILVAVKNNGNIDESSNVGVFYNGTLVQQLRFLELEPEMETSLTFEWNTTGVPEGTYSITAQAEPVSCETNILNNVYNDGTVTVKRPAHEVIDVAVVALSASPNAIETNVPIRIDATVQNLGSTVQNFTIEFRYDESLITTIDVHSLSPGASRNLTITWDNYTLTEGNYTISAYIPLLPGEENTANNLLVDGTVWIRKPQFPQLMFLLSAALAVVLLAGIFLLVFLVYCARRRRRRRRKALSYYTVVARPHI